MGFFDELFKRSAENEEAFHLGRFSDAYKPSSQQKTWEKALLSFESEEYFTSFIALLEFLKNTEENNVFYNIEDDRITFELYQGSKVVSGYMNKQSFRSQVKIAQTTDINIGLSRKLLERNYLLKYARFAINEEGHILLIFDSYTVDASPNKLYQGLREMATQGDKLDDLILDEFKDLKAINNEHIIQRSEELKEKQYQYLKRELAACFQEIEQGKLNIDQFPGGLSFLLLALNYKLDYILTPQGFVMDSLEQNHRIYFTNSTREIGRRNNIFLKSFRKIMERKESEIKSELYDVICTFGLPTPSPHDTLIQLIQNELENIRWYKENNHTAVALAIPSYIVGYALFNYALPKPDMELLRLFYKISEYEYFGKGSFWNGNKLNSKSIRKEIERIESKYRDLHPNIAINTSRIDYSDLVNFSETYLLMIKNMTLDGGDR